MEKRLPNLPKITGLERQRRAVHLRYEDGAGQCAPVAETNGTTLVDLRAPNNIRPDHPFSAYPSLWFLETFGPFPQPFHPLLPSRRSPSLQRFPRPFNPPVHSSTPSPRITGETINRRQPPRRPVSPFSTRVFDCWN